MDIARIAAPSALGVGLALGGVAAAASLQPTFSPRSTGQQALLTGVSAAGGFGVGWLAAKGIGKLAPHVPGGAVAALGALVAGGVALHAWSNAGDGQPGPVVGGFGSAGTVAATIGAAGLAVLGARAAGTGAAKLLPASMAAARGVTQAVTGPLLLAGGVGALGLMYGKASATPQQPPSRVNAEMQEITASIAGEPVRDVPPPLLGTVTGSGASAIREDQLNQYGRRFVHEAVSGERIRSVMGEGIDPIRAYAPLTSGDSPQARVDVAMAELERFGAFDGSRDQIVVATPTGLGFIDPPSIQSAEFMARGRIATVAIQYANKPSIQSTGEVPVGAETTKLLLQAVRERVDAMPADQRPEVLLFGESLGAWAQQEVFEGHGTKDLAARGTDRALWVGTPHESGFAGEATGELATGGNAGELRQFDRIEEVEALDPADRDRLRYVVLTHRNDPVAVVNKATLGFQRPEWLPAVGDKPNGVPASMHYVPGVSLGQGLIDLINGTHPVPGKFEAHAHDYRADLPEFVRVAYGHDDPAEADHVTDAQVRDISRELMRDEKDLAATMARDETW